MVRQFPAADGQDLEPLLVEGLPVGQSDSQTSSAWYSLANISSTILLLDHNDAVGQYRAPYVTLSRYLPADL